jgi:ATP-dependent RNA helicase RhlE
MELPLETESYVHRIGRTARAGESGAAISFVTHEERGQLKAIERLIKKSIPVDRDHPFEAQSDLPPPAWVAPMRGAHGNGGAHGPHGKRRRKSFAGRRQIDFGQKKKG